MKIIKLQGMDSHLYELVAPLVMNPAILRQNNNYPFKTGRDYVWYVAMREEQVVGFMPIKKTVTGNCIDNYYISGDDSSVIEMLLGYVIEDLASAGLSAVVHKRHVETFAKKNFGTSVQWKKYNKMQYLPKV